MAARVCSIVVQCFGVLILGASLYGLVAPADLVALVSRVADHSAGTYFAVGIRIILGVALILAAPTSRFPIVFKVLGWVTIAAAVGLALIGQGGMQAVVDWVTGWQLAVVRASLLFGLAFAVLLIYGARYRISRGDDGA